MEVKNHEANNTYCNGDEIIRKIAGISKMHSTKFKIFFFILWLLLCQEAMFYDGDYFCHLKRFSSQKFQEFRVFV